MKFSNNRIIHLKKKRLKTNFFLIHRCQKMTKNVKEISIFSKAFPLVAARPGRFLRREFKISHFLTGFLHFDGISKGFSVHLIPYCKLNCYFLPKSDENKIFPISDFSAIFF